MKLCFKQHYEKIFYLLCFFIIEPLQFCFSQTKVSGIVVDKADQPVPLQI
jgi:hypothetical protein